MEGPSISAAATLMETSNSSLSTEHQNLSKVVSPRISTSLLHFDSQEVGSDDEGIIKSIYVSEGVLIRKKNCSNFFAKIKHETLQKAFLKDFTLLKSVTKSVKHKTIVRFNVVLHYLSRLKLHNVGKVPIDLPF